MFTAPRYIGAPPPARPRRACKQRPRRALPRKRTGRAHRSDTFRSLNTRYRSAPRCDVFCSEHSTLVTPCDCDDTRPGGSHDTTLFTTHYHSAGQYRLHNLETGVEPAGAGRAARERHTCAERRSMAGRAAPRGRMACWCWLTCPGPGGAAGGWPATPLAGARARARHAASARPATGGRRRGLHGDRPRSGRD